MPVIICAALVMVILSLAACESLELRRARQERAALGNTLYVEARGSGPAIVFLPGLMGSTRFWSRAELGPLEARHRLLFIDELGFGRSPWPNVAYTLDEHLDALRRTLVREGATQHVVFVAHSFGTILAAHYAQRYPDEVDRLYLLGTPVFRDEAQARRRIGGMSRLAALFANYRPVAMVACRVQDTFRLAARRIAWMFVRGQSREVVEDAFLHYWPSVDRTIRNVILQVPIEPALRRLGSKVTLVHGRADRVTPLSEIESLAERIGGTVIVTNNDHGGYVGEGTRRVVDHLTADPGM